MSLDSSRRSRGGGPSALRCLIAGLVLTAGSVAAQDQPVPTADGSAAARDSNAEEAKTEEAAPAPTRAPQTRSEIERALDLVRREHEELVVRIGDAEPSAEQRSRLWDLSTVMRTLKEKLAAVEQAGQEKAAAGGDSVKSRWLRVRSALQDATRYDLKHGMFRFSIGVRFQFDSTVANEDDQLEALVGDIPTSFDVRRARIFAEGRLLRRFDFKFEYDFAADQGIKDAYLEGAKFTKYFKWRIGHFKEPFSLARQTSNYDLGFLEWALPVPTFSPGRNLGLMLRHSEAKNRLFWAISATTAGKTTDDNRTNANFSFTGRLTGLPLMRDKGRRLLHVGISASVRDTNDDTTQFTTRPEARFAPFFADTGTFDADSATLTVLEAASVFGQTWIQAEWFNSVVDAPEGDLEFGGGYVEAGWFMTGEHKLYVTEEAAFGRLTPVRLFRGGNPFRKNSNGGALEFVGRFSTTDLNDGSVQGGELRNFSLGVNWYLSQVNRVSLNYVHSYLLDTGRANIVLLRYQYNP
jgi:phosphate-selective porin OprO/OprP